ncbi:MAG: type III pantothenate kinase [Mycoplasmataceae bacterium]|nr:type III pantothenate kinase [Mycoplasmataceae bacterium]
MKNIVTIDIGNTYTKFYLWNTKKDKQTGNLKLLTKDLSSNLEKIKKFVKDNFTIIASVVEESYDLLSDSINLDHRVSTKDFKKESTVNLPPDIGDDILAMFYLEKSNEPKFVIMGGTIWACIFIYENQIRGANFLPGINWQINQIINGAYAIKSFEKTKYNFLGLTTNESILDGVLNSHIGYIEYTHRQLKQHYNNLDFIISSNEALKFSKNMPSFLTWKTEIVSEGLYKLAKDINISNKI